MPKGPWEEPRTIFDAMITAQMRKMIPTAARIETQPAGSTESSFHTGGSQCMTQRCPQIVPCGQRMRLSSLVMRLSPVDGCLHSIVHEGWAWGVLAMKMVCTAGLLVGTTAGPDATPGGTVKLKFAGNGLGALAGASCNRACASFRQCHPSTRRISCFQAKPSRAMQ